MKYENVVIFGASGGIGSKFLEKLLSLSLKVHCASRSPVDVQASNLISHRFDFEDEASIKQVIDIASAEQPLDLVLVTTGMLHTSQGTMPEKSMRELSPEHMLESFTVNTLGPSLVAKYALPKLRKDKKSIFAALSARVGSISDNRLGGWYSYRASKAALNMMIKCFAIETQRKNKEACVIGLHPGTVDTGLSKPFQRNLKEGQLFTADYSTDRLLTVLDEVTPDDTGCVFAWDGQKIPA